MGREATIEGEGALGEPVSEELERCLGAFSTLSLDELAAARLMKRRDTKFVFSGRHLETLVSSLSTTHRLLEVNERSSQVYRNLYFDTAQRDFYRSHHNGELPRVKWRQRFYLDSRNAFLEKKTKNNRGDTSKERIAIPFDRAGLDASQLAWIAARQGGSSISLLPSLWSRFRRITLVDSELSERLTIDVSLAWALPLRRQGECALPEHWVGEKEARVIVELKGLASWRRARCAFALEALRLQPRSWSKYAIGLAQLEPSLKANLFKSELMEKRHYA